MAQGRRDDKCYIEAPPVDKFNIEVQSVDRYNLNNLCLKTPKIAVLSWTGEDKVSATLKELSCYPIVLPRSLDKAKQWLKEHRRGSERIGILASSKADRLKAISINVRYQPDFVEWFLAGDDDIRSSNRLEDTLTEFKVQGLKIDWACIAWDADMRLSADHQQWEH